MAKIRWNKIALDDLDNIAEYIAKDSERYAAITIQKIFDRADHLKLFPFGGRKVPEMNHENIRELIEGNYRIIYEVHSQDDIEILTVFHGARLLQNQLEQE
ncbi:MAG TPA: type II toxin-antitoxin system RelE/ParE family toxin [Chitinophagales bacterium]|nr:type II toxin-antitoxin system RelE/ParE family toxin [Chitinophagales bacterium]